MQHSFLDGIINEAERDTLLRRVRCGEKVFSNSVGSAILIHGTNKMVPKTSIVLPKMTDVRHPQTLGCVGMSNVDIFALRDGLESASGTVLILP